MIIKNIKLHNFRNYEYLETSFNPKINVIYGNNGSGKTNLVEAIYFLSHTKSFRTNDENLLIKFKNDEFVINSIFEINNKEVTVDVLYSKEGKKILINDKKVNKISDLLNTINIIVFSPKDVNFLKESPKGRRSFLDLSISRDNSKYFQVLSNYKKILKERNNLLKQEKIDLRLLDIYDHNLIENSFYIYKTREEYLMEINGLLSQVFNSITKEEVELKIEYKTLIKSGDKYDYQKKLARLYSKNRENDLIQKKTRIGLQYDDFIIKMNDKDISLYGSQGQNRLIVLSLKLVPYFISKEEKKPIIILDDVLSELDSINKNNFIEYLSNFEQVFITNTNSLDIKNLVNYQIKDNQISKEEV